MRISSTLLMAAPIAAGLLLVPAAKADWHHDRDWHGGWHGGGYHEGWHHDDNGAGIAAGAILGLGAGALIGGAIAAQQQPYYYAPPPAVVYAPPPAYYPPAYYPRY